MDTRRYVPGNSRVLSCCGVVYEISNLMGPMSWSSPCQVCFRGHVAWRSIAWNTQCGTVHGSEHSEDVKVDDS